jgi:hypothetical protein
MDENEHDRPPETNQYSGKRQKGKINAQNIALLTCDKQHARTKVKN